MPQANTITTQDVVNALDQEFVANFDHEVEQLTDILGIVSPEIVAAGTALYQYKGTGALNEGDYEPTEDESVTAGKTYYTRSGAEGAYVYTAVAEPSVSDIANYYELVGSSGSSYIEGDLVALSHYKVEKVPVGDTSFIPYRKVTTAQAIAKAGFENAVLRTDNKMLKDVRGTIVDSFYRRLDADGGATATGATLQALLAQMEATLADALERNHDSAERIIHWVNRFDVADYLADANVSTQTAFGMTYLESFLGIENVIVTSAIPKGAAFATPDENLHLYGVDFGALGEAGLVYEVSDSGLIGVHHDPKHNRTSVETNVLTGAYLMPEMLDYIVKGTIVPTVSTGD